MKTPSLKSFFYMNKFVKISRDCLALGEHREAGSIVELPEKTCNELVNDGAAIYFKPPPKAEIETAVLPESETAARKKKAK